MMYTSTTFEMASESPLMALITNSIDLAECPLTLVSGRSDIKVK